MRNFIPEGEPVTEPNHTTLINFIPAPEVVEKPKRTRKAAEPKVEVPDSVADAGARPAGLVDAVQTVSDDDLPVPFEEPSEVAAEGENPEPTVEAAPEPKKAGGK